jgi:imidazolonepropionase-like amidohydrolase
VDVLGYPPLEALSAATKLGGQLMGLGDELGLLAPGYLADVLVVAGNPADDVRILQDPANLRYIIQGGQFHKSPQGR